MRGSCISADTLTVRKEGLGGGTCHVPSCGQVVLTESRIPARHEQRYARLRDRDHGRGSFDSLLNDTGCVDVIAYSSPGCNSSFDSSISTMEKGGTRRSASNQDCNWKEVCATSGASNTHKLTADIPSSFVALASWKICFQARVAPSSTCKICNTIPFKRQQPGSGRRGSGTSCPSH